MTWWLGKFSQDILQNPKQASARKTLFALESSMKLTYAGPSIARVFRDAKTTSFCMSLSSACFLLMFMPAMAQQTSSQNAANQSAPRDVMTSIETPAQSDAIELGTGPLPDANTPESWHSQYGSKFARNVTVATLTPFLPDPSNASGAAVIVAPGGGFRTLSWKMKDGKSPRRSPPRA